MTPSKSRTSKTTTKAKAAAAKKPTRGRPSLTGEHQRSPRITIRVAPETRDALEAIADAQGRSLTDVSREALEEYTRRHG